MVKHVKDNRLSINRDGAGAYDIVYSDSFDQNKLCHRDRKSTRLNSVSLTARTC